MRRGPTVIDPTLTVFEGQFVQRQGELNPSYAAIAAHLPAAVQRDFRTNSMDVNEANVDRYRKSYAKMVAFVGMMHRAGIPLVAGTDAMAGLHAAPGARALSQGRHPAGRGPADRDLERRQATPAPSTGWVRSRPASWPT